VRFLCGIIGFITFNKNKNYSKTIKNALQTLDTRGPNHKELKEYDNVVLGHVRLSILDLSSNSNQPMEYEDRYTLVYNGEIYNYKEIREKLIRYGYKFYTEGDTEVVLKAYDYWGDKCVDHFNGMWAFAIYDMQRKKLFCSRDQFGIKPFFYYQDKDIFVFASEIKAILEFIENKEANLEVIAPFIIKGITDFSKKTFFKNIYRLLPSHNLYFDLKTATLETCEYYQIKNEVKEPLNYEEIYKLLEESVSLRLRSDVKVGTCLSGGLDSSCIAAIAKGVYGNKLEAVHAKSTAKRNDESEYAKIVAKHLGIKLHIIEPSHQEFWKNVDQVIYTQDEPFSSTSIFMQYFVMEKAKEIGCTVMLDGQGADEVFLGYENYLSIIYNEAFNKEEANKNSFFETTKLFKSSKEKILADSKKLNNFENEWDLIIKNSKLNHSYLDKELFRKLLSPQNILEFQKKEIFSKSM